MKKIRLSLLPVCIVVCALCMSCGKGVDANAGHSDIGPQNSPVEPVNSAAHFKVDHPEKFPLVEATVYNAAPELNVTGVVNPDISRQVPVISLASGRVVEIDVRLGDYVKKGQLLFKVRSPDIAQAFSDYMKAVVNEQLAAVQLKRAKELYDKGAIPKSALEIAQNVEDNAKVDVVTTAEHLRVLGVTPDPDKATGIVPIYAPTSGVITDQQITDAAGVQALNTPSPLTISDVSRVWVLCDVYENDLAQVHLGQYADIRLNAYPSRVFKARIGNIGEILDPNIRTAKVRLEVDNPGMMRLGMFATATFHGRKEDTYAAVPASAILHLQDRNWVYASAGNGVFQRYEVVSGDMLPGNRQQILSGISPGTKVASNALDLQSTVSQ